ncbi:MAG: Alginate exp protein [Campylobacterota bacterium]|nr:Alginate exp protein [Campylobacterota bacterium]
MKKIFIPLSICASLIAGDISFDGQIRLRHEYYNGVNDKYYGNNPSSGLSDDAYLLTRVRLGTTYKVDDSLLFRLSAQDSRALGYGFDDIDWYNKEFMQKHNPQKDYFEFYETYVQKKIANFEIKAGRQKMAFGDNRVFGPGEWRNSGKWVWDVLKATYKKENDFISLFYGATMLHDEDKLSTAHRHGYYGYGAYSHFEFGDFKIEPMLFSKENTKENLLYNSISTYYAGVRAYGGIGEMFYDSTLVKSFGKKEDTSGYSATIDGYTFIGVFGYNLNKSLNFGAEYVFASGDNPNTEKVETYDTAFGASDLYYGRMNLMQITNLIDYSLFSSLKIDDKLKTKFEYHRFYADRPTNKWLSYQIATMQSDHYGDEIDLVTTYSQSKNLSFQLGLGYFFDGSYIKEASLTNASITNTNAYSVFTQLIYSF